MSEQGEKILNREVGRQGKEMNEDSVVAGLITSQLRRKVDHQAVDQDLC